MNKPNFLVLAVLPLILVSTAACTAFAQDEDSSGPNVVDVVPEDRVITVSELADDSTDRKAVFDKEPLVLLGCGTGVAVDGGPRYGSLVTLSNDGSFSEDSYLVVVSGTRTDLAPKGGCLAYYVRYADAQMMCFYGGLAPRPASSGGSCLGWEQSTLRFTPDYYPGATSMGPQQISSRTLKKYD